MQNTLSQYIKEVVLEREKAFNMAFANSNIFKEIAEIQKAQKIYLQQLMQNQMYVYPEFFKCIEGVLLQLPKELVTVIKHPNREITMSVDDIQDENDDSFYILSHISETSAEGQIEYRTTRTVGIMMKKIVDQFRKQDYELYEKDQKITTLKGRISKIPYDVKNTELIIAGKSIKFIGSEDTHKICAMIFGDLKNMSKVWAIDDFVDALEDERSTPNPTNRVKAIKSKIYRINDRIEMGTNGEVKGLIICRDSKVVINPEYLQLFKLNRP